MAYSLTFRVRNLKFSDIGSFEPAQFSPLVLLKPVTYAVTVGVSDRPGVHDALFRSFVTTRIATTRKKLATGIQLYTSDERFNE